MTWNTTSPNQTPEAVARRFVEEVYPGRQVEEFFGDWNGRTFTGNFRLENGVREYTITSDEHGHYRVTA